MTTKQDNSNSIPINPFSSSTQNQSSGGSSSVLETQIANGTATPQFNSQQSSTSFGQGNKDHQNHRKSLEVPGP